MHVQASEPSPGAERDLEQVDIFRVVLTGLISRASGPRGPAATMTTKDDAPPSVQAAPAEPTPEMGLGSWGHLGQCSLQNRFCSWLCRHVDASEEHQNLNLGG